VLSQGFRSAKVSSGTILRQVHLLSFSLKNGGRSGFVIHQCPLVRACLGCRDTFINATDV